MTIFISLNYPPSRGIDDQRPVKRKLAAQRLIGCPLVVALSFFWISLPSCIAQTSTSLIRTDPRGQYQAVKTAMQALYDRYEKNTRFMNSICNDIGDHLGHPEEFWAKNDGRLVAIADLAYRVVYLRNDLSRLGYPAIVWREILSHYENDVLNQLDHSISDKKLLELKTLFFHQLSDALANYRDSHPDIGKEDLGGECGDGDIEAKIVTQPRASQVLFTPSFYYELCKAQNIDPENTARCNRWREAIDGKVEYVAGDYHYIAKWSDGTTRRGTFRFGVNDDGKVITLHKP